MSTFDNNPAALEIARQRRHGREIWLDIPPERAAEVLALFAARGARFLGLSVLPPDADAGTAPLMVRYHLALEGLLFSAGFPVRAAADRAFPPDGLIPAAARREAEVAVAYGLGHAPAPLQAAGPAPAGLTVGPFEPTGPAPLALDLALDGERVISAVARSGYNRRNLETAIQASDWGAALRLAGRLSTATPMAGMLALAEAVEGLAGVSVPLRGQYLRLVLAELERAAAHLGTAATLLRALGAGGWDDRPAHGLRLAAARLRGALGAWTGARYAPPLAYGGLLPAADPDAAAVATLLAAILAAERDLAGQTDHLLRDRRLAERLVGLAPCPPALLAEVGASGPLARAAGRPADVRVDWPSGAYAHPFGTLADPTASRLQVPTQPGGDAYARFAIWLLEALESLRLARLALESLPGGAVCAPGWIPTRGPSGAAPDAAALTARIPPGAEGSGLVEAPDGALLCVLVAGGPGASGPRLAYFQAASHAAVPLVEAVLPGLDLAEVPAAVASLGLDLESAEK